VYHQNKNCVVRISKYLLEQDFDPAVLPCTTLYQIGEYYGRAYSIPSLVDVICAFDRIAKIIFFTFLLLNYIYQTKTIFFLCLFVGTCCFISFLIKMNYFYKNLKDFA